MQVGITQMDWLATDKTRTVDVCPECMRALQKEAVNPMSEGRLFGQSSDKKKDDPGETGS